MNRRRTLLRVLGALGVTSALALGGTIAATAAVTAPTPDVGPTTGNTTVLVPEPESLTFTDAAQSREHGVATGSDGQLYAWGSNDRGQLGIGTTSSGSATPVGVTAPAGIQLSDSSASYGWSLAIGSDGGVYAWGENTRGKLGNGTLTTGATVPTKVLTPTGVTFSQTETGEYSSWALGSDGQVYGWGRLVGTQTDAPLPIPTAAPAGVTFTQISGGNGHILALGSDGNAYAWGSNGFGQLGNGTSTGSATPVLVSAPSGVTFTQVAAGGYFSVALGSDGKTYAWGYNDGGQLGVGNTASRNVPTEVLVPAGVTFTEIAAGYDFVIANTADGASYGWGGNLFRTVGDGTNVNRTTPVLVQTPAGVTLDVLALGDSRSLAIGADGKLYVWSILYGFGAPTLFWPTVTVTGVTFDGLPGTDLGFAGDGDWSVVTPAHAAGPVDVVVEWTLNGVPQTPVTYVDGFTYIEAPTITDPADQTVVVGSSAVFEVDVTGYPDPTVTWEYSTDGGETWQPIAEDSAAVVADDGLSVTVTPTSADHDGHQYRATATNIAGSATSEAATLTVTTPVQTNTPTPDPSTVGTPSTDDPDVTGLAQTGGGLALGIAAAGVLALFAGTVLVFSHRELIRRRG